MNPEDAERDPTQIRQVQSMDGALYLRADDVVASLRAQAASYSRIATRHEGVKRAAFKAISDAFVLYADRLDVASVAVVTAEPSPWIGGRS